MMISFIASLLQLQLVYLLVVTGHPTGVTRISVRAGRERPTKISPANLPEGYVPFFDHQVAYKIHERLATWNEARERCMEEGGHLAIADSREKIEKIKSLNNQTENWLHVGIYHSANGDHRMRVDNDLPVTSLPWVYNHPSRNGSCVGISLFLNGLVDYLCGGKKEHFVCEIPIFRDEDDGETSSTEVEREVTTTRPADLREEGYVEFHDLNVAYKIHKGLFVTWWEAHEICQSEGGNLAIVDSREKFKHVRKLLDRLGYSHTPWLAVGIYKSNATNQWVRVDNDRPVMSAPGISGETKNDSRDCAFLSFRADELWDFFCHHKAQHFICEIPITVTHGGGESTIKDQEKNWETTPFSSSTRGQIVNPGDDVYGTTNEPTTEEENYTGVLEANTSAVFDAEHSGRTTEGYSARYYSDLSEEWLTIEVEVQASTTPRSSELPEGYVVYAEDRAAYKVHYSRNLNWYEARDKCISDGAHLIITDSYKKMARLHELVSHVHQEWVPVGIHKSAATDKWVRADNDLPVTSPPWGRDEPTGHGNCAYWWHSGEDSRLRDLDCSGCWTSNFVCQIPITENNSEEESIEEVPLTEEIQTTDPPSTIFYDDMTSLQGTPEWYTTEVPVPFREEAFSTVSEVSTVFETDYSETFTGDYSYPITEETTIAEIQTSTTLRSSGLPEGYVVHAEDHAAYKVHAQYLTWQGARDTCTSEGAHLPITDSQDKITRVLQLVNHLETEAWIPTGIHKSTATNEWVRIDNGLPVTSLPWISDWLASQGNCAAAWNYFVPRRIQGLIGRNCDNVYRHFVCQISVTENK